MVNFDDVLDELGDMGKFQITTFALVCLPLFFAGANSLSYVFTAGIPEYRCEIPGCDDPIKPVFDQSWLPNAIPNQHKDIANYKPVECTRYIHNGTNYTCTSREFSSKKERCDQWVFGDDRTIVNDWSLTCIENQWKLSLVGNSHFIGIFLGSFIFGVLSDRYGRKNIFVISIMLMGIAGIAHVVSPNYIVFVIITMIHAIGTSGVYPLGFVLGVELVGKDKREMTGILLNLFYGLGEAALGGVAWYMKDWRWIQLTVSAPCLAFILYIWFIPESVRWLMARKKTTQATKIINKAAKINKVKLSEELISSFRETEVPDDESKPLIWPTVREIGQSKLLIVRYICIFIIWSANAFIYYGFSLNSTSLIGNKYLNFTLTSLVEVPGYLLSWILILKLGRKYSLMGALVLCSINCTASIFVDHEYINVVITLFLLGKLCITASFGIIYVYTAEMFPTVVRSGGVALASSFARGGAFLAPFVPLLGLYVSFLPMLLFAVISGVAALLVFKLPETMRKKLPETVSDAINI